MWWNWKTPGAKNAVRGNPRAGSTPVIGTNKKWGCAATG